jgi:hypothetical protein
MGQTRYSIMNESTVKDPVDLESYPDTLSVNFNKYEQTYPSLKKAIDSTQIDRFWIFINLLYGSPDYEDLVLILNNIPYRGALSAGDVIYFPDPADISSVYNDPEKLRT